MNIQPRVAGMAAFESIIHRRDGIGARAAFSDGSGLGRGGKEVRGEQGGGI